MFKYIILSIFVLITNIINSQNINYSTAWFGPNASPVPETGNAVIPEFSNFQLEFNNNISSGDKTKNLDIQFEFPIIKDRVSLKLWMTTLEYYEVDETVYTKRQMLGEKTDVALGDVYIQNRFRLSKESSKWPNIILQSTIKTATGTQFYNRRFYDTPSYYFDLEFGKTLLDKNNFEFKIVADIGFYSWQMYSSVQNDAPMYSLKLIPKYRNISLETDIAGYSGWKNKLVEGYGDRPVVWRNRLNYSFKNNKTYISFEKGLRDYPYTNINLGLNIPLKFISFYEKR